MKILLLLFLFLISCAGNKKLKNDKAQSIAECNEFEYYQDKDFEKYFLKLYEQQYGVAPIKFNCARIYVFPSFKSEYLIESCPKYTNVYYPDTGMIWTNVQIFNKDKNGNIISGRVANVEDSIPPINIKIKEIEANLSDSIFSTLNSINIWEMKSVRMKKCLQFDGTHIEVQAKNDTSLNHFKLSLDNYDDENYNNLIDVVQKLEQ